MHETQGNLKALLISTTESALLCDTDGNVIVANETAAKRFNTAPDKIIGKNILGMMTEEAARHRSAIGEQVVITRRPSRFLDKREGRHFDTTVYPVISGDGSVERLAIFSSDITEKHKAEMELKESEDKFRIIIENSQPVIFMIDRDGTFILSEGKMLSSLGLRPGEVVGLSIYDVYKDYPQIISNFRSALSGELKKDLTEVHGEKGKLYFDTFYSPYRNPDGNIIGIIGMAVDITERIESENKLTAAAREKEILLKEIHHRVKNNLSLVSSLHRLQARKLKDEELSLVFKETQSRVKAMALVHEMLYRQSDLSQVSLEDYVRSLLGSIKDIFAYAASGFDMKCEIERIPVTVDLMIPLGLILNELITNVFKHAFTKAENNSISIIARKEHNTLFLQVADNGPGLPSDVTLEHLETLGLELVKTLVGQLTGTIEYVFEKGAVFRLSFPL